MPLMLSDILKKYPQQQAPFLHRQYQEWKSTQPLRGLKILHHVPVVQNTIFKIACLVAGGAEVVVTNPRFVFPCDLSIAYLQQNNIRYVSALNQLIKESFDLHLDCGAELYQSLPAPKIGAVELTGTGDEYYRQHVPPYPVISIDHSRTKQLETVFGTAVSAARALEKITDQPVHNKSWLLFGFGKIGHGIAYYCMQHHCSLTIVDVTDAAKLKAKQLQLNYIDASNNAGIESAIKNADIIITATGKESVLSHYPKSWFAGKTLANMGVLDEFGEQFTADEVINNKKPINFVLEDPTPIEYIDPELYVHNQVIIDLINSPLPSQIHDLRKEIDTQILQEWCQHYGVARDVIDKWFIEYDS